MSAKGSALATNEFLGVGDYLVSDNGVFFAMMQGDGNFCVYRGSPPGSSRAFLWGSVQAAGYSPADGDYFAVMQSDGNFCCYQGKTPADSSSQGFRWGTVQLGHYPPANGQYRAVLQDDGNFCVYRQDSTLALFSTDAIDPVKDVAEITSIVYDVASAKVLQTSPEELYRQTVHNNTDVSQSSSISGSRSIAETSGWSDSLAVKVGAKTTFKTGIPYVAEGKIEVSVELTNTYTWNGSETETKTWNFSTPVTVPPHSAIVALVAATLSTIAVPYTLSGTLILQSGAQLPGHVSGIYTGSNSHDMTVTFTPVGPGTKNLKPMTMPLSGTLT